MELHQAISVAEEVLDTMRQVAQRYGAQRYMMTDGPFPASTPKEKRKLAQIQTAETDVRRQIEAVTILVEAGRDTFRSKSTGLVGA